MSAGRAVCGQDDLLCDHRQPGVPQPTRLLLTQTAGRATETHRRRKHFSRRSSSPSPAPEGAGNLRRFKSESPGPVAAAPPGPTELPYTTHCPRQSLVSHPWVLGAGPKAQSRGCHRPAGNRARLLIRTCHVRALRCVDGLAHTAPSSQGRE